MGYQHKIMHYWTYSTTGFTKNCATCRDLEKLFVIFVVLYLIYKYVKLR